MEGFFGSLIPFARRFGVELLLLTAAFIIACAAGMLYVQEQQKPRAAAVLPAATAAPERVTAEVSGAVIRPGVYALSAGARLGDLLARAGGLSPEADADFVARTCNLARYITDQEKIHIPRAAELSAGLIGEPRRILDYTAPQALPAADTAASLKLSINTASIDELDALPGIGKATAQKIIENRPYAAVQDLVTKNVMKPAALTAIAGMVGP